MSGFSLSGSLSLVKGVKARGHSRLHGTVHVIASVIGIRSLGPACHMLSDASPRLFVRMDPHFNKPGYRACSGLA